MDMDDQRKYVEKLQPVSDPQMLTTSKFKKRK